MGFSCSFNLESQWSVKVDNSIQKQIADLDGQVLFWGCHTWVDFTIEFLFMSLDEASLTILCGSFVAVTTCKLEQVQMTWWQSVVFLLWVRNGVEYLSFYNRLKSSLGMSLWLCKSYGHAIKSTLKEAGCPWRQFYWDHFCSFWSEFYFRIWKGSPRQDLDYIVDFLPVFQKWIKCSSFGIEELNLE